MELAVLHIGLPWAALVEQNVPNPFNAETMIGYHVFRAAQIELHIYDIAGQRVRVLREGVRAAGGYRARWDSRDDDGRRVSSGVYLYRIVTPGAESGPEGILGAAQDVAVAVGIPRFGFEAFERAAQRAGISDGVDSNVA
jgi:hypothetical protein